jgi:hypothetical protein
MITLLCSSRFGTNRSQKNCHAFRLAEAADESELYRIVSHCERDRAW